MSLLSLFEVLETRRKGNEKSVKIALRGNADHGSSSRRPASSEIKAFFGKVAIILNRFLYLTDNTFCR